MKKLYFLGPKGTYSEIAAKKINEFLRDEYILEEISTITKIVDLIGENDIAILPIENSIEGIVRPTIDALYEYDVQIQAQLDIDIKHCLFSSGSKKENIKYIISHPQALAQCSKYILKNFDSDIKLIESTSTAAALVDIIDKSEQYSAIASSQAGKKLGLNLIDENIGDNKDNKTRFVLISKNKIDIGKNTRTSIVFNTKNEPGALLSILEIFKKYNLNLIYLESRPSKKVFGEYNFFADIDKGVDEIGLALCEIRKECNFYKLLGSYPSV